MPNLYEGTAEGALEYTEHCEKRANELPFNHPHKTQWEERIDRTLRIAAYLEAKALK